ncbi:phosphoheptose isomerase [Solitalea lacus]|uniref:phosphoheptose isomerase n=1 Tax=Solitalea lacus TaxID=2911172 RepID=UPI001EDAE963|nr:phosphoheptose isomerase [Solitalea lacus]UKJ06898.1 phosphoheptose isomerase [Solitalea lacus]
MLPEEQTQTTNIFESVAKQLKEQGFTIVAKDETRPWGGFFVLDENDAEKFIEQYFPGYSKEQLLIGNKLSPKILLVAPNKRLSWQYHFRRAEIWRVVSGKVAVATSFTDEETQTDNYEPGQIIVLQKGQRHRLIGLDGWGSVAEIWQHTDINSPSDEDDIVRLQDDFGRN